MPTRCRLDGQPSEAELTEIRERAGEEFPEAGWSIRTRLNAAPSLSANIERFSQFLTLVGLTALVVGGVGVANAVRAYLDGKRGVIATFKSLGASGGFVFTVYLIQMLIIAGIGIVIGLVLGALMPFAAQAALASIIPVPAAGRRLSRQHSAWRRCSACWSRWPSHCFRLAARETCRRPRCFARWVSRPARCRAGRMSMRRSG